MILPAVTRGELPKYKSIFLNIENDEISMFASSKDEPVNVTLTPRRLEILLFSQPVQDEFFATLKLRKYL